jgi:hypothetical protein
MIGGAAESIVLELRDAIETKLATLGRNGPRDLKDWRIKKILDGLRSLLEAEKTRFPVPLKEEYESYWPAFTQQIRAARNDAGHPSSVEPITPETVHASLLIFPELLKLATALRSWVELSL